jgi:hypothetical protein
LPHIEKAADSGGLAMPLFTSAKPYIRHNAGGMHHARPLLLAMESTQAVFTAVV